MILLALKGATLWSGNCAVGLQTILCKDAVDKRLIYISILKENMSKKAAGCMQTGCDVNPLCVVVLAVRFTGPRPGTEKKRANWQGKMQK